MDLKLDTATGDLDMSTNDLQLVTGSDAIAQHIKIKLRFFQGEWFLDLRIGMPYYQRILGIKNPNIATIRSIFRSAIESTPGVESTDQLVLDFDNAIRQLQVEFNATITGEDTPLEFEEVFII